jgi:hypothetical protein
MAEPKPLRAIFRHTIRFYDALSEQAKVEEGLQVYRGHPTTVATDELDLPLPYYSEMRQILITIGSVKQIKRGSGKTESVWVLVRQPTEADFEGVDTSNRPNTEFRLYQLATDASIARLEARLGGLDVVKAVLELNAKLDALQAMIDGQKTQKEN